MITDWTEVQLLNVLAGVFVFGGFVVFLDGHLEGSRRLSIAVGVGMVVIGVMMRSGTWA